MYFMWYLKVCINRKSATVYPSLWNIYKLLSGKSHVVIYQLAIVAVVGISVDVYVDTMTANAP